MKEFNVSNFVDDLSVICNIKQSQLRAEVEKYIWPRLDFLTNGKNKGKIFYLIDNQYVETEWKDMISVHYINTSYHCESSVIRVHLSLDNKISSQTYVGFFTLRKIDEPRIMLSYIYPSWEKIKNNNQKLFVMTYKKRVHIMGEQIEFFTYPLFVQDNITVACAQADIIAMTNYLHNKFDYNKIRISDLSDSYSVGKTKIYPTNGLNPLQMSQVFNTFDIPIRQKAFDKKQDNEKYIQQELDSIRDYINYTIESAIPVLLGISIKDKDGINRKHIIQLIGHSSQTREQYVIYDDSGFFLKYVVDKDGFVALVSWKELEEIINKGSSFIICPIHEKVYLYYEDIVSQLNYQLQHVTGLNKINEASKKGKVRYALVDNRIIKKFISSIDNNKRTQYEKNELHKILSMGLPHYVWYCEIKYEESYVIYIADPTYSRETSKNIFINELPIYSDKQLSLLGYIK